MLKLEILLSLYVGLWAMTKKSCQLRTGGKQKDLDTDRLDQVRAGSCMLLKLTFAELTRVTSAVHGLYSKHSPNCTTGNSTRLQ